MFKLANIINYLTNIEYLKGNGQFRILLKNLKVTSKLTIVENIQAIELKPSFS